MVVAVRELEELRGELDVHEAAAAGLRVLAARGLPGDLGLHPLAHGHDHPQIRTGSTPEALRRLRQAGLLREADFEALAEGYDFLRRVELRLRIVHDFGVDHLPEVGPALRQLARRLGYAGPDPGGRFLAEYARVTAAVRHTFDAVVAS